MSIDLRSDTVTRPTAAMRRAMADAEVGDDGYGEDPTVNRLQEVFAAMVGKEAALFVPSGTMGNQIALRLLGRPGTAVLVGRRQHVVLYEQGGAAVNGWAQLAPIDDTDGTLSAPEIRAAVEAGIEHHWLPVGAVCVENTHMPSGGTCWPVARLAEVAAIGQPVHLDGARLFNAAVACGLSPVAWTEHATTVMCCLSKGLGAPVGSVLAGSADLIRAAGVERKRLGGAMRQAGVVAAAGIVALEQHVARLVEDHIRARRLADAVAERWPESGFDPSSCQTNCVVFRHADPAKLLAHLADHDVLAGTIAPGTVRLMTHLDVDDAGVDAAIAAIRSAPA